MSFIRNFVQNMSEEDRLQCIRDYEEFEFNGFIGDCKLRETANIIIKEIGEKDQHQVVIWMEHLMKEVFRYYAMRYIETTQAMKNTE